MEKPTNVLIAYKYRLTEDSFWFSREQEMFHIDNVPRTSGNIIDIFLKKSNEGLWLARVTIRNPSKDGEKKVYRERGIDRGERTLTKRHTSARFNRELDGHMNEVVGKYLSTLTFADAEIDNNNKTLTARSDTDALKGIFGCLSEVFDFEGMAKRYLAPEEQIVY